MNILPLYISETHINYGSAITTEKMDHNSNFAQMLHVPCSSIQLLTMVSITNAQSGVPDSESE